MKVAHLQVDCCKNCPYAVSRPGMVRVKLCAQLDNKLVDADQIDEACPLEDATMEVKWRQ